MENIYFKKEVLTTNKTKIIQNNPKIKYFDTIDIINNLFYGLSAREKDVIIRRYGLHGQKNETLENIGKMHSLTRERIRQIEISSINKIQNSKDLKKYAKNLSACITEIILEHGGLIEKTYLLDILIHFSSNENEIGRQKHKNYLDFIITKFLFYEFSEINNSKYLKSSYKLKEGDISHFEESIEELIEQIKERKLILTTEKLINLIKNLNSYNKHSTKFYFETKIDLSAIYSNKLYQENISLINLNKPIYSLVKAIRKFQQNKFGFWGHEKWSEIIPKNINDKIFLVLSNYKQPMHFKDISEKIEDVNFDNKRVNCATVHNELILDNKYVLVGRGIYGLKEWGYTKGTVSQVIEEILSVHKTLSKSEIIEKVLKKRFIKKSTIILALMNKNKFIKDENGNYSLKLT